jgi:signal transduction histidine kinase
MERMQEFDGKQMRPTYRRERIVIPILVLIIVLSCLIYVSVVVRSATATRVQFAMDRNLTIARLSARLLNEQWDDMVSVLTDLSTNQPLEASLRANDRSVLSRSLKMDVDVVPELLFTAAYRPDGRLVTSYPDTIAAPENAFNSTWFKEVSRSKQIYRGEVTRLKDAHKTKVIVLAVPIGKGPTPAGYLFTYYRMGDIDDWLNELPTSGTVIYVTDAVGHIIDATNGASANSASFSDHRIMQITLGHHDGATQTINHNGKGKAIVGYAYAKKAEWTVLIFQPVDLAFKPSNMLITRFTALGAVLLTLLLAAAWGLDSLYRRQINLSKLLAKQNDQLRAANAAKSDFLANVSHDLRTPLAGLKGSISGLLDPEIDLNSEGVKDSLKLAGEEIEQLETRVRNLLEMTRLEAGAWPLQKVLCDLTDIVGSTLERIESLTTGRYIKAMFPPEPMLVDCDPIQIETVMLNLLENAIKYSPTSSPIHIRGENREGSAYFFVRDSGPGVPKEEEERIFDKFYRASAGRPIGGTGLGLAICKTIIEEHGGDIGVHNMEIGAEFWFCIPAAPAVYPEESP